MRRPRLWYVSSLWSYFANSTFKRVFSTKASVFPPSHIYSKRPARTNWVRERSIHFWTISGFFVTRAFRRIPHFGLGKWWRPVRICSSLMKHIVWNVPKRHIIPEYQAIEFLSQKMEGLLLLTANAEVIEALAPKRSGGGVPLKL